jgi:hypothetical protein
MTEYRLFPKGEKWSKHKSKIGCHLFQIFGKKHPVNTALTTVNIAKVIQNALLLRLFFSKFGNPTNSRKNQKYFKELLNLGTLAT